MADHDRLLDEMMGTHSLYGVFDTEAGELEIFQLWDAPPADERLLPGPDVVWPWTTSS